MAKKSASLFCRRDKEEVILNWVLWYYIEEIYLKLRPVLILPSVVRAIYLVALELLIRLYLFTCNCDMLRRLRDVTHLQL